MAFSGLHFPILPTPSGGVPLRSLDTIFHLAGNNTTVRTEIGAGLTTFMTMAYIIFVNPAMIAQTGMDAGAAMMATCLSAAAATVLMGLYANYPIALAPGMGENAFFTYTVCLTMGVPWRVALGAVFIEGLLFIVLTLTRVRQALIDAIPAAIRYGIACGIGLFIAFLGLKDAGLVVPHPATLVTLGDVVSRPAVVSLVGLAATGVLLIRRVRGALLGGILITAAAGLLLGVVRYRGIMAPPPSIAPTFLQMDVAGALSPGLVSVVFILLFMDVFDTVGTLAGVGELGGFMRNGVLPRSGRALMTDAVGTCIGAACGTPTVTSYIESAAGVAQGGRTGLASVVTGLAFMAAVFFSPLVTMIGGGYPGPDGAVLHPVTAPALIVVGCFMLASITRIDWRDYAESLPAFLVIVLIPLTFSIATGIAFGFISYAVLKACTGRGKEVSWIVYVLAALFLLRFVYLAR
jgi:AGZA family xanthine/uracil permease-like MFS transporter